MTTNVIKDPDARLDYGFNWNPDRKPWLATGEVIVDSVWEIPDGLQVLAQSFTDADTVVWLGGGENSAEYVITNRITTNQGRIDDRSQCLSIRNR